VVARKDSAAALRREIGRTEKWLKDQQAKLDARLEPQRVALQAMQEALLKIEESQQPEDETPKEESFI
jgi:hypothetical protein